MKSTIYNFDQKIGLLDRKFFKVRDYFQYYTTGVENIIRDNPDAFVFTRRNNAERPEQIMYDIYEDENLADTFVAINNQNYIWATPFDLDSFEDAVDLKMNYVEFLMRDRVQDDPISWDIMYERVREDVYQEDEVARTIVVPSGDGVSVVNKMINDYFENRTVS